MSVIGADTRIDETEDTFAYLQENEQQIQVDRRLPPGPEPRSRPVRNWLIGGKRQLRSIRNDQQTETTDQDHS